jgi:phosphotransferase system  glucose/maltose/N-acetylglucosamine-specific IIC component
MGAIIGGIVAIIIGILLAGPGPLGQATLWFIGGGIVVFLILGGIIAIAAGISDIKDKLEEKKEEKEEKKEEKTEETVVEKKEESSEEESKS